MQRRYHILDVFTSRPLTGNPLAVVLDSEGLDTVAMQSIAREFNLSETVFVSAPADPLNFAKLRIFTPATELPFAGHPTVGTAILLAKLQAPDLLSSQDVGIVLEEGVGPVSCSVRHRRGEAAHASFDIPVLPSPDGEADSNAELARLFGLAEADIGFAAHRPQRIAAGNRFTFIPVASIEALGRATYVGGPRTTGRASYYLYTPDGSGRPHRYRSRMLAAGLGITEDPATGSAVAAFTGALLANETLADGDHDCTFEQGVEMGRASFIGLTMTVMSGMVARAAIGGSAVMVAKGHIDI